METKRIKLTDLVLNEGKVAGLPTNPRQWTKTELDKLKKSLQETPELLEARGILVYPWEGKYLVLGGNMRLSALKSLKATDAPCIVFPEDTPIDKLKEVVIKDNGSFGEWDYETLANLWDDLPLADWGVPAWETSEDQKEVTIEVQEDDFDENEQDIQARCKLGDIWKLGDHRLMCGDATDQLNYDLLLRGEKIDLVFTDPPYGMGKESEGVKNDNLYEDELLEFNKRWIPKTISSLSETGSWYCWGIDEPLMDIYSHILMPLIRKREIKFRNLLTWDKGHAEGQMSEDFRMYAPADEKCLFVMKGSKGFFSYKEFKIPFHKELCDKFSQHGLSIEDAAKIFVRFQGTSDNEASRLNSAISHLRHVSMFNFPQKKYWVAWFGNDDGWEDYRERYEAAKKAWREEFNYFDNTHDNMNSVWHFDRTSKEERELCGGHATPKPLALCGRAIKTSSRIGESILDVFGGSGSTLIAAEQLNRRCYMMELDPHYCDVIISRWEKLTGKEAELIPPTQY